MEIPSIKAIRLPEFLSARLAFALALLLFYLVYAIGNIYAQYSLVFDDAFISYRYARNLANGFGLVWNPGEAPLEGYTNFLLVVILAPFIRLGADPLLVTRILSFLSMGALCVVLYRLMRRKHHAQAPEALLCVTSFLLFTNTDFISLVGLETILYTVALFASFLFAQRYFETGRASDAAFFGAVSFLTFLLRPEVVFLIVVFALVAGFTGQRSPIALARLGGALFLGFGFPLLVYLAWKFAYFGELLPNPSYVKMPAQGLFAPRGLASVTTFLSDYHLLVAAAILTLLKHPPQKATITIVLFCLVYGGFYLRVDTLMDIGGRFLYPLTVFLLYLSLPLLLRACRFLLDVPGSAPLKIPVLLAAVTLILNPAAPAQVIQQARAGSAVSSVNPNSLMQKEYQLALTLREYPGIKNIRIAFGDAGVIPYFTEALSLDDVGLNDRFIARETDLNRLVNYYFEKKPDLVILTSEKDQAWTKNGHGPLGNFSKWHDDPRWDKYHYVGTVKVEQGYDLHLFLHRETPQFDSLYTFLREQAIDGYYNPFPLRLGSYKPERKPTSEWLFAP